VPLHLFCEPGTPLDVDIDSVVFHKNDERRGALGNWRHCLRWLREHCNADYLLVCEDDVEYCRGAKSSLFQGLEALRNFGFLSLYTPKRDAPSHTVEEGWFEANFGRRACGAQSMCFSRNSAAVLLDFPRLEMENSLSGPTDTIVSECFLTHVTPCYYHRPSLANHIGRQSTIGHEWFDAHTGFEFDPEYVPTHLK